VSKYESSLDLIRAARLGLNFLNRCVDLDRRCQPYFVTQFKNDPAELRHDWPDFSDLTSRYIEALFLVRKMLALTEPTQTELALRKLFISFFSENDGLSYRPSFSEPYFSTILNGPYNDHVAEVFDQSRVLWTLLTWYRETGDKTILKRLYHLVEALNQRMIKIEDWGCYEMAALKPGYFPSPDAQPMRHQLYFAGSLIHALVESFEVTGMELSLEMAKRLTNYVRFHADAYTIDGRFTCVVGPKKEPTGADGHTHTRLAGLAGMIRLGTIIGDRELVEWAQKSYDWFAETFSADFGWSPEFVGRSIEAEGCETCAIMDHLQCLLTLTQAGFPRYWNDFERIVRNHLLEQQIIDTRLFQNHLDLPDTDLSCFHDVGEKVLGGFGGWCAPNDFVGNCDLHFHLMNCCGPSGVKAIYLAWNNIFKWEGDCCTINLLMDHESLELSIKNHQPRKGQIEITSRRDCVLKIRIPDWVNPAQINVLCEDKPIHYTVHDIWLQLPFFSANKTLFIEYPLRNLIRTTHINGRNYKVHWVGDTVVSIDPPGRYIPLYERKHLL
jgi:hypothetical protein